MEQRGGRVERRHRVVGLAGEQQRTAARKQQRGAVARRVVLERGVAALDRLRHQLLRRVHLCRGAPTPAATATPTSSTASTRRLARLAEAVDAPHLPLVELRELVDLS